MVKFCSCFSISALAHPSIRRLAAGPWKDHRKFLNPCFSLKILQSYMPIFNAEVKTLVSRLQLNVDKDAFNMYDYMDAATLDVVCRK